MRIGIDARLQYFARAGIARYTRDLLTALTVLESPHQWLAIQDRRDPDPACTTPGVERFDVLTPAHNSLERVSLPVELVRARLDLLHSTDFVAPAVRPFRSVVTVHDLAFILEPELVTDESRRYYQQVDVSAQKADAIIAVSARTARDVTRLLRIPPERVHTVHSGVDARFRPLDDAPRLAATRKRHGLPDRFVLTVGTVEPRKNLPMLLEAVAEAVGRGTDMTLVHAGSQGWLADATLDAVDRLGLTSRVQFLGSVSEDDLLDLYNLATLFVLPSRYEGFGFPLLEAMACGTPSLASDAASLPELAGDAARLLPVDDPSAWAAAMEALWEDAGTRDALAQAGPVQAARFSWDQTARQTLAVYEAARPA